jgi:L-histidine N-alpha-methyltransferase
MTSQTETSSPPLSVVIAQGLQSWPKQLPARVLYDEAGSRLFEQITRLPEYYPTEAERALLAECADDIWRMTHARTLVEFGAGIQDKTRLLIDAGRRFGSLQHYQPIDISSQVLIEAARSLDEIHHGLTVEPVVGDFMANIQLPDSPQPRLTCFLGGTIGNLVPAERVDFLRKVAQMTGDGGFVLVGTDLVKPLDRIVNAYNDESGVTAAFLLNVVNVMNAECGLNLQESDFDYVPLWDAYESRMDLRLRSRVDQTFNLDDHFVHLAEGEEIRIEVSTKFTLDQVREEFCRAGLDVQEQFRNDDFGLTLARWTKDRGSE